MVLEDFIANLTAKYRSKNDDENDVFYADLNTFVSAVKHDALQDVYNYITREHEFATIPRIAKLWKYAKKEKLLKEKPVQNVIYWNVCDNCGTKYSKQGKGCPKCRCTKASICTGDNLPDNIIEVQEDCFYCNIYPESVKRENDRKQFFTGCTDFGIKQDPHCSICQCKECCKQMIMYNAGSKVTTDKYKSTELAQPWIKKVQPLNETVKQMVDDIARRRR